MLFHTILSRIIAFVLCSLLAKTRSVENVCGFVITSILLFCLVRSPRFNTQEYSEIMKC